MSQVSLNHRSTRLLVVLVMTGSALWAQAERGAITGTVTDATGGVIPGAEITVTNVETNVSYSTTSTGSGTYRVPNLPPGTYNVNCTKGGFKQASIEKVRVAVSGTVTVDVALEVGAATQAVTVEAHAEQLQTRAEINTDVSPKEFRDMAGDHRYGPAPTVIVRV